MTSRMLGDLALKVWGLTLLISALTALPAGLAVFKTISAGDAQAAMFRATEVIAVVNLVFHAVVGAAVRCSRSRSSSSRRWDMRGTVNMNPSPAPFLSLAPAYS
jgi:hypothetical protein